VTSGLRKVTDDMKSKNQADRTGHVAGPPRAAAAPANGSTPAAAATASTGPPRWVELPCQQLEPHRSHRIGKLTSLLFTFLKEVSLVILVPLPSSASLAID
jgi:hypothetical protein